jgi:hypothetical protein
MFADGLLVFGGLAILRRGSSRADLLIPLLYHYHRIHLAFICGENYFEPDSDGVGSMRSKYFIDADDDESRVSLPKTSQDRVDRLGTAIALLVLVMALFSAAVWFVEHA